MNRMVNNYWVTWILVCMLRTYRIYNLTMKFLKYEFNNKLLGGVIIYKTLLCLKYFHNTFTKNLKW